MKENLRDLHTALEETFASNFVSYYRAHVAHVNLIGSDFPARHKLLQKVYEYLQENIDILAEKLRTTRAFMPRSLGTVIAVSAVMDYDVEGDQDELLETVNEDLETLIDQYHAMYEAAEAVNYIDISNYAQDQIGILAKHRWMLESTLGKNQEEDEDDEE